MPGFFDASPGLDRRSQSCIAHIKYPAPRGAGFFYAAQPFRQAFTARQVGRPHGSLASSAAYLGGFKFLAKQPFN